MAVDSSPGEARTRLESERARLVGELTELGRLENDAGLDYDANFADSSQVTAERGEAEALAAELREALSEVDAALHRLEEGTYGTCESCGGAIGEARLEAMPAAVRCITCASRP
jgi:DnaK suppressor protein